MLFGEPVTTSATGSPKRLSEAPATMEIITAQDIRMSGETDLPGILSRVGGVSVQRFSRNASDVSIRGYNRSLTPRLLVLLNGRQTYLDTYGYTQWDLIPVQLEEIRQIEIVKGPNAALFGFNAVSGVINIITFDPTYDDHNTMNLRVDQDGGLQGSLVKSFKLGKKLSGRGSIGGYDVEEFDNPRIPTNPGAVNLGPTRFAANADLRYQLTDKTVVGFESTYSELTAYERTGVPTLVRSAEYESSSYRGTLDSEGAWGLFSAEAYNNKSELASASSSGVQLTPLLSDLTVLKAENVFKPLPQHTFRLAAEYRDNSLTTDEILGQGPSALGLIDLSYEVSSASGMWNWQVMPKLSTTIAVRTDSLTAEQGDLTESSYNAAMVYAPTDSTVIRVQAARGLQILSLFDLGITLNVDPAVVDNYSVDLEQRIPAIGGSLKASVFHQQNTDLRQGLLDFTFQLSSQQVADSDMTGFELAVDGTVGSLNWDASYIYLSLEDELKPITQFVVPDGDFQFAEQTPEHEAKFQADYQRERFSLGGAVRYVSERAFLDVFAADGSGVTELDPFVSLDLRAAYELTDSATLAFESQDLTNGDEVQVPAGFVETRAQVSLTVDF